MVSARHISVLVLLVLVAAVVALPKCTDPVDDGKKTGNKKKGTTVLSADAVVKTTCSYNCAAFQLGGKSVCTCPKTNEVTMTVDGVTSCPTFETLVFQTIADQIRSVNTIKAICETKIGCKCTVVAPDNVEDIIPTTVKVKKEVAPTNEFISKANDNVLMYMRQKEHEDEMKVLWGSGSINSCPDAKQCDAPPKESDCEPGHSVQKPKPFPGCPANGCYKCMKDGTGIPK